MQLFPSIHTISLWVNNLAAHPASSLCFGKAIAMVTAAPLVTPPCQMARTRGRRSVENITQPHWRRQRGYIVARRALGDSDWLRQGVVPRVREREEGKRVPHVLSRASVDNAR